MSTDDLTSRGVQVWQALSELVGGSGETVDATVMFTELCGFATWVLEAGDEAAMELLRTVAAVVEPAVATRRGRMVKRLSHGHMAVFKSAGDGVAAALDIQEKVPGLEVAGHRPRLRAGLHRGQPRRVQRDYLGADVNIAARVSEAARAGEVLVSADVIAGLQPDDLERLTLKRRRGFRAKGSPPGLKVFSVTRA